MNSNAIVIDSIILAICCALGVLVPKIFKDEDERYGMNALIVAFVIGFLVNMAIFYITSK